MRNNNVGLLHRLIMNAKDNEYVDHINFNKLDNRKCNLRICSKAENTQYQQISTRNTSGYKGVSWDKENNKWYAQIKTNGKHFNLGRFDNKHEAAKAYNIAAIHMFGEFAKLNDI